MRYLLVFFFKFRFFIHIFSLIFFFSLEKNYKNEEKKSLFCILFTIFSLNFFQGNKLSLRTRRGNERMHFFVVFYPHLVVYQEVFFSLIYFIFKVSELYFFSSFHSSLIMIFFLEEILFIYQRRSKDFFIIILCFDGFNEMLVDLWILI